MQSLQHLPDTSNRDSTHSIIDLASPFPKLFLSKFQKLLVQLIAIMLAHGHVETLCGDMSTLSFPPWWKSHGCARPLNNFGMGNSGIISKSFRRLRRHVNPVFSTLVKESWLAPEGPPFWCSNVTATNVVQKKTTTNQTPTTQKPVALRKRRRRSAKAQGVPPCQMGARSKIARYFLFIFGFGIKR